MGSVIKTSRGKLLDYKVRDTFFNCLTVVFLARMGFMAVEGKFIEKIALLVFVRVIFRCFSPSQKPQVLMRTKTYILHTVWLIHSPFLQAEILVIVSIDLIGLWPSNTKQFN